MTHHNASTDAEPNLVPLLDLVLQLIMFFMTCAQIAVTEQSDNAIRLPQASQAKPIPADGLGPEVVFLNITRDGEVKVFGRPPMKTEEEIVVYLKRDVFEPAMKVAKDKNEKEVGTVVVIRADESARFELIYKVMRRCQEAGLRKVQLRAMQGGA